MLSILELIKDDIVLEAGAEKKIVEKTCDILDSLKRYTIENFYKLTAEEQLLITFATLDFYTNFSLTKQVDELYLNYIKEPSKKTEKQEDYEIDLYKALLEGKLFQAIAANEIKKGSLFDKVIIPIKNTPDEDL